MLALWKLPVNSVTRPDPRSPDTVTEPPGLKIIILDPNAVPAPVVQLIVPFAIPVFGSTEFNCVEVRREESPKTRDEDSVQVVLEDVFELNEMVSAKAATGLINNTNKPIRTTFRMTNLPFDLGRFTYRNSSARLLLNLSLVFSCD
jgi:hypothetical protein